MTIKVDGNISCECEYCKNHNSFDLPIELLEVIIQYIMSYALFLSDMDRETYLRLWRKYSRELEYNIYAY